GRADTPSSPELPRDARGTFGVRDRHDSPPPSRGGRVLTPPAHPAPRPDRQRAQDRQDNARHDREIHPDVLTLILDIPRQAPEPGAAQGPQKQARDHDERADANQDLSELAHEPPSSLFP